jgi:TolB protein
MKRLLSFLTLLAVSLPFALHAAPIAFSRNATVCVAEPDGSKVRKVTRGVYPDISADGKTIVFNTDDPKTTDRKVALVDVASGKVTTVPNIPSDNCYGPALSPDERRVAFHLFDGTSWHIAVIDVDGKNYRQVKVKDPQAEEVWTPVWAADGKSLFCHDFTHIYRVTLDGRVLQKWPVTLFGKDASFSSGNSLALSPDGRTLLVEADRADDIAVKGWAGPPPALWTLDLSSSRATQVSPASLLAWDACWLDAGTVLAVGASVAKPDPALYRISLADQSIKRLLNDAVSPSAARQ